MPAKVRLDFVPPVESDIAKLHIYESVLKDGPYTDIEVVTAVGAYPDYITYYMTSVATAVNHWFSIAWETAGGIVGPQSAPIQGGTSTLVYQVVTRVLERDPLLEEVIVTQEAEAAIQMYFGNNVDPYDVSLTANYRILNGLAYLVMARANIARALSSSAGGIDSATLGLVSFRGPTGTKQTTDVKALIDLANKELGIGTSFVFQLESVQQEPFITADFSRLVPGWLSIDA